jgi:Kef-type K+ transport system membrane component KefB
VNALLASSSAGATSDPIAHLALALGLLLVAARLAGEAATRLGQPQVLGELVAGIALGSLPGTTFFHDLGTDPSVDILGRLGAVVLLFDAGLALNVGEVLRVGGAAARVAVLGTCSSLALGWIFATWLLPDSAPVTRALLAAALGATSVGISARVLKDISASRTVEARTILSAAVLDDVIGLVVLSLVSGWAGASGPRADRAYAPFILVGKTVAFLAGALLLGRALAPRMIALTARLRTRSALVVIGLAFCFLLAWAADAVGLAAIVGAFTAGLVLEEGHWREFVDRGERGLDQEIEPLAAFLAPLFFALLGLRTDLRVFAEPGALALAGGLTLAALLGKLACGLGAQRGSSRLAVSFGMMPRGEVSLIVASLGLTLGEAGHPALDHRAYSAIVMMVVLTTLATPLGLKWSFARAARRGAAPSAGQRPLSRPGAGWKSTAG